MEKAQLISRIIEKLLLVPTLLWIYTPIVAGILTAMTYLMPLGFGSWWIFSIFERNWLLNVIFIYSEAVHTTLLVLESILFAFGLFLFLWGLFYLAKVKLKKLDLATGGPYKYIRHPQHLGLIIMSLATSLYLPWAVHTHVRIGSIISWSLFALFLVVASELEEKKLLKKIGNSYFEYRINTGMFFPKKLILTQKKKELSEIKHWKRLIFIVLIYSCFVSLIRILCIPELRIVGMWYDSLPKRYWYLNLVALGLLALNFVVRGIRKRFISLEKVSMQDKSDDRIVEEKSSIDVQEVTIE